MQTNRLEVCNIGLFDNMSDFWADHLGDLLRKYPTLEFPHKNTFYMILFIEKGTGEIIVDNCRITVANAQIIIIKPNCITKISLNREAIGKIICFTEDFFSLRYNNNILNQFSFFNEKPNVLIKVSNDNLYRLESLMTLMHNEFNNKNKASKKALRSYLNILLIELERFYNPLRRMNVNNPTKEKVERFQKLIEKNFKTMKLPSDYALILNISTNYLNKICKKTLDHTSGDLIRKHTVLEAQKLLSYTNYSVGEVANALGFEHASYFVTFFKKITNQTPEQFRKGLSED